MLNFVLEGLARVVNPANRGLLDCEEESVDSKKYGLEVVDDEDMDENEGKGACDDSSPGEQQTGLNSRVSLYVLYGGSVE